MNLNTHINRLLFCLLFGFPCAYLWAGSVLPETPEEIRDTWGSVLYCQEIYKEPSVHGRIYPADTQACKQADQLMRGIIRKYGPNDQQVLETEALKKSKIIRYNTRDVQEAVRACREQCGALSAEQQGHAADQ
jgi:hypothetical protein